MSFSARKYYWGKVYITTCCANSMCPLHTDGQLLSSFLNEPPGSSQTSLELHKRSLATHCARFSELQCKEKEREARNKEQLLQKGRVGWRAASDTTVKRNREENEEERHGEEKWKNEAGRAAGCKTVCVCLRVREREKEMTEAQKKDRLFCFLSLLTRLPRATEAAV